MKFLRVKNLNMWLLLVVMASSSRLYAAEQSEVADNEKNSFKPVQACNGWQPKDGTHELDGKQPIIEWEHKCKQGDNVETQEFRIVRRDGEIVFSGVKDARVTRLVASAAVHKFIKPLKSECRNLNAKELNDLFEQERLSPVKILPEPIFLEQPVAKKAAVEKGQTDIFPNFSLHVRKSIHSFK